MRKQKKRYQGPSHPWQGQRIKDEMKLAYKYGLVNKKEIWRSTSIVRRWREEARRAIGLRGDKKQQAEAVLLGRLRRLGVLAEKDGIDDVLALNVDSVLERRLQTVLFKLGLAGTVKQARQFIIHKKVVVNEDVMNSPNYNVKAGDAVALVAGFNPSTPRGKEVEQAQEIKAQIAGSIEVTS